MLIGEFVHSSVFVCACVRVCACACVGVCVRCARAFDLIGVVFVVMIWLEEQLLLSLL